jgi:hypothetical protein
LTKLSDEMENVTTLLTKTTEKMSELDAVLTVSMLEVDSLSQDKSDLQIQLESCKSNLQQSHSNPIPRFNLLKS